MPDLFKYRVWCTEENMFYEEWAEQEPVGCPNNRSHVIDSTKTTIVNQILQDEKRDSSGKLRVHQTSRPLGTKVHFAGRGDDITNILDIGGGEKLYFRHRQGDDIHHVKYVDFNCVENKTYIHEGYVNWKTCDFDEITVDIVPRTVTTTPGTDTEYFVNPAMPYIVLPSILAGGAGNVDIVEDLSDPITPGLVFTPEFGDPNSDPRPPAYWDADWNSDTKLYENITPKPSGDGEYNIFTQEIIFSRFANCIMLVHDGFLHLKTSDTDQIGHGMRIKIDITTNLNDDGDHDWHISCLLTMHREKSV